MLTKKKFILIFIFLLFISSCGRKILIPCTKDAFLTSLEPDINFSGRNEAAAGSGYGVKKSYKEGYVTYPAMYAGNTDGEIDSFLAGGFDLSTIKGGIRHASLKFFINYSSNFRKNVCLLITPVISDWQDDKITFNDVYIKSDSGFLHKNIIQTDIKKRKIIVFDIKKTEGEFEGEIPYKNAYKTVSADVTDIMEEAVFSKNAFYGFLIEPMSIDDPKYITADMYNVISDYGILEIACNEWLNWNGTIPETFYLEKNGWIDIKNKAFSKIKYIPRLEITVQ